MSTVHPCRTDRISVGPWALRVGFRLARRDASLRHGAGQVSRWCPAAAALACCWLMMLSANEYAVGDTFYYVDWTAANPSAGTASGVITLPDSSTVDVGFEVLNPDGSPGSYTFAQTNGGTNYWVPSAPYISPEVENPPPTPDILALVGGSDQVYNVSLSEPIKDPIMAIVSLGQPGVVVTYDFDRPFTIVSQGTGYWGGNSTSLSQLPGDILRGTEGHGTIRFDGTFDSFSWTAPMGEFWHGFTYGIRTTERLEPEVPEPNSLLLVLAAATALGSCYRRTARFARTAAKRA